MDTADKNSVLELCAAMMARLLQIHEMQQEKERMKER
jgi:hypothetical protein